MCASCGCNATSSRTLTIGEALLSKNDRLAAENRGRFTEHGIAAINIMGAPGAGKTALLEAVIPRFAHGRAVAVLEGDQETDRDAARIRELGAKAVQITTGAGCHLDAHMVGHALDALEPEDGCLLLIENVGNLVCPALFDLGEHARALVLSVTEGEDKPLKYPHMFRAADALVVNKVDLLPHLAFDLDRLLEYARRVNPRLVAFCVCATSGEGLDAFCGWLSTRQTPGSRPRG